LFSARQCEDSLLRWLPPTPGRPGDYHEYLKSRWRNEVYTRRPTEIDFERFWNISLHEGFITATTGFLQPQDLRPEAVLEAIGEYARPSPSGIDLVLTPSPRVFDGRFANNGWLQELPHPVTTQVWGNGALMSRATAQRLQCREGDVVRLTVERRSLKIPALIEPGMADDLISIDLGYGRRIAGSIGSSVGVDAGTLRKNVADLSPWFYTGVGVETTGESSRIIRVQTHFSIEGRPIIKEASASAFRSHPLAESEAESRPHVLWSYRGYHWAMVVDLTACTGCGACSLACTAENNIPVVGPEQVSRKREMHWMRIDRYYSGSPDNPSAVYQPILCQHCDAAPCEKVCPVAATVRSPEGLNEMVYNRCVGTRYCANNCPYKVRRFNFFNYHKQLVSPAELVYNPEVTVRNRGIMEKCTFCVQRITAAKHRAKIEGRKIRDGEIQTACQQACPAEAIVFGDLNDPQSRVSQLTKETRAYHVLDDLGVRPSVTYLAKIRNPRLDTVA